MDPNMETEIGNIIQQYLKIEWMRYNMYLTKDIYNNIPLLVFRIDKNNEDKLNNLARCVSDFKGINKWKVFASPFSTKGNYILSLEITEMIEMENFRQGKDNYNNPRIILGEELYRKLCEEAIQDIPFLIKHLRTSLFVDD